MNKFLLLFSLLFCAALSATDVKGNLHALLICDTLAHKWKKNAYLVDFRRMKESVEGIAVQSQLKLDLHTFTERQVTAKSIENWISNLNLEVKDVVLIYYVGRQDRHAKLKGRWPGLKAAKGKSISGPAIAKRVQKHKPRLTLIFFDCYDHLMELPPGELAINWIKIPKDEDYSNIQPLFTRAKGVFMACSCPKGKKTIGLRQKAVIGGVFTTALIESIVLNDALPSWAKGADALRGYYDGCFESIHKPLIYRHVKEPHYTLIHKDISPAKQD